MTARIVMRHLAEFRRYVSKIWKTRCPSCCQKSRRLDRGLSEPKVFDVDCLDGKSEFGGRYEPTFHTE